MLVYFPTTKVRNRAIIGIEFGMLAVDIRVGELLLLIKATIFDKSFLKIINKLIVY